MEAHENDRPEREMGDPNHKNADDRILPDGSVTTEQDAAAPSFVSLDLLRRLLPLLRELRRAVDNRGDQDADTRG